MARTFKLTRYTKAIVTAVSGALATAFIVWVDADPDDIAKIASTINTAVTTFLVYRFPNKD